MKDPCRNPELMSSFTFTGTIACVETSDKTLVLSIEHLAADRFLTDFKLIIPRASVGTEEFPFMPGEAVMVEDALVYEKDNEVRLRIADMSQIWVTTARPGEVNALSFSGKIVDIKEETGYNLVYLEQNVYDTFMTRIEVIVSDSVKMEYPPKVGDIGLITHALFYEKDGSFRAKLNRKADYKVLYTPDVVMDMGTIEAKELFI